MLKKLLAKLKGRPKAKAKPRKPIPSKPKPSGPPPGDEIGRVVAFFRIPVVAVVKITKGSLKLGDRIWIKGHTTDLKQAALSLQINHQSVQEIKKGEEAGIKVSSRARRGDRIYRL